MANVTHSDSSMTAPAAPPRPIFEKIDSDEVITQLTVGKEQVWAVNRMGEVCWRHNKRDSYWRKVVDVNFKDVEQMSVGPQGVLYAVKKDGSLHRRGASDNRNIAGMFWTKVEFDSYKAKLVTVTDVAIFVASDFGKVFRMMIDPSGKPMMGHKWQTLGTMLIPVSMSSHPVTGKVYVVKHDWRVVYLGLENGPSEIDYSKQPMELWKWVDDHKVRAKTITNTSSEVMVTDEKGNVYTLPLDGSSEPIQAKWQKHPEIYTSVKCLSAFGEQTWFVNGSGEVFAKGLPADRPRSAESVELDCQCTIL